jgi:secondary thiamine-phosphate synthase enzyme
MGQRQISFEIHTSGRGFSDISDRVQACVERSGVATGLANVFIHHTSASLIIGENADPDVLRDLRAFLDRLAPDGDRLFVHTAEGPDDMPAHVRSVLTATSISIPITAGRLALGTWQGVFICEHRLRPHLRRITVTVIGA